MLLAAGLPGCALGPNFQRPADLAPPAATAAAMAGGLDLARPIATDWWSAFGDPVLDDIERRAVAGNLDIGQAAERVQRSRAAVRIAGGNLLPTVGAGASYLREKASPKGILALTGPKGPPAGAAGGTDPFGTTTLPGSDGSPPYNLFQTGIDASWEIDLWGKARRTREAARADAEASELDRQALRVSISAEVARTYMMLRGAEARLAILQRNHDTVARGLEIAERREAAGAATRYDAASAAAQFAALTSAIPGAERDAASLRNALALLCGEEPHALDAALAVSNVGEVRLPALLPGAMPSSLARSRPDILSAEAALHAATARIGAAKADFYPSISLTGSFGTQSLQLSDLAGWGARQFVAGPTLHLPIFEGGRLKGQLALVEADQRAAAIRYRATVLRAWHEVDDALEGVRAEAARLKAAATGVAQSQVALRVSERRYRSGASAYLDVLVAERATLEREAELAAARTADAAAITALYRALGGGWSPAPLAVAAR